LPAVFEELVDPCDGDYPLAEILVLVLCATLNRADTFVAMKDVAAREFGKSRLDWLQGLLPYEDEIPSHFCA